MEREASHLPAKAVVGAAGVALAGAGVWALVMLHTDYEYAMIAWGIGAAVGAFFHKLGGRGQAGALLCAVITAGAIVGGKYIAVDRILGQQREIVRTLFASPEAYAEMKKQAEAIGAIETDEDARAFMVAQGYVETPDEIDEEMVAAFRETDAPFLQDFPPTYEAFVAKMEAASRIEMSKMEIVLESLTAFDALFFLLAVFTAWQLALGRGRAARPPAPVRTHPREDKPGETES